MQHTNSSNKELSPANKVIQKDNAFMRAMLRDDNRNYMSPYNNFQHSSVQEETSTFVSQPHPTALLQSDPFFESFGAELRDMSILGQKLKMGQ